jgi:hypothetical protein
MMFFQVTGSIVILLLCGRFGNLDDYFARAMQQVSTSSSNFWKFAKSSSRVSFLPITVILKSANFALPRNLPKKVLTMCDWVLPWCFLANSAASPLAFPASPEDFKCEGSALLAAIMYVS